MGEGAKRLPAAIYENLGPECQLRSLNATRMARCDEVTLGSQVLGGWYSRKID